MATPPKAGTSSVPRSSWLLLRMRRSIHPPSTADARSRWDYRGVGNAAAFGSQVGSPPNDQSKAITTCTPRNMQSSMSKLPPASGCIQTQ